MDSNKNNRIFSRIFCPPLPSDEAKKFRTSGRACLILIHSFTKRHAPLDLQRYSARHMRPVPPISFRQFRVILLDIILGYNYCSYVSVDLNMHSAVYFVTVSTLLHLSWLYITYELYFLHQPNRISHDLKSHNHNLRPPADRVVMFAIKGLTLNHTYRLYNNNQSLMPFTRNVIFREGRWGVSHLSNAHRVTDTKNIYLAGVTQEECYSGETKCFDDIINGSSSAWIWSCEDHMYSSNEWVVSKVHKMCLKPKQIDCSTYTEWMSNDTEDLLLLQSNKRIISDKLSDTKTVFLYNMDVSNCMNINEDLIAIDQMINNTADLINSYFNDSRTAFLLFGIPESNQSTANGTYPFIAWGAGIRRPRSAQYGTYRYDDDLSSSWNLERFERIDLNMVDIVPLVAVLLGTRFPVYSEGIIPHGYIHYNKEFLAETLLLNVKQFLEKVRFKEEVVKSQSLSMFFRPFKSLTDSNRNEAVRKMEVLINDRKLQEVIERSLKIIQLCNEAFSYYNTYHHLSLQFSVTITCMGWIIYTLSFLLKEENHCLSIREGMPSIAGIIISVLFLFVQYRQDMSLAVFICYTLPVLCWDLAIRNCKHILKKMKTELQNVNQFIVNIVVLSTAFIGLQMIVLGLVHHYVWLLLLILLVGCLAPYMVLRGDTTIRFGMFWILLCLSLGYYPLSVVTFSNLPSLSSGLLVIGFHIYLLCDSSLKYRLTVPGIRMCLSFNTLLFDTILFSLAFSTVITSKAIEDITMIDYSQQPHIIMKGMILVLAVLALFIATPKSVPGRLLHIWTILYTIFIVVSGFNYSVFLLLLVCLLICCIYMADITPFQNDNPIPLWNGIFGCVYHSEFPTHTVVAPKCSKLPTINDIYRVGHLSLLVFVSMISVIDIDDICSNFHKPVNSSVILYSHNLFITTRLLSSYIRLIIPLICIYSTFSVLTIKVNCTLETFFCSAYLLMDVIALQVFMATGTSVRDIVIFIIVILNVLLFPIVFVLARIITGNSIIPRKACDK